jgi:hypothetical protein
MIGLNDVVVVESLWNIFPRVNEWVSSIHVSYCRYDIVMLAM